MAINSLKIAIHFGPEKVTINSKPLTVPCNQPSICQISKFLKHYLFVNLGLSNLKMSVYDENLLQCTVVRNLKKCAITKCFCGIHS